MSLVVKNLFLKREGQEILRGITLDFPQNHITSILDVTGSGAQEFLAVLGGIIPATSGSIFLNGKELVGLSDAELALIRRDCVSYILPEGNLLPSYTVKENIEFPLKFARKQSDPQLSEQVYKILGLQEIAHEYPAISIPCGISTRSDCSLSYIKNRYYSGQ